MTRGFEQALYILSFDHGGSFKTGMFGWKGRLTSFDEERTIRRCASGWRLPPKSSDSSARSRAH